MPWPWSATPGPYQRGTITYRAELAAREVIPPEMYGWTWLLRVTASTGGSAWTAGWIAHDPGGRCAGRRTPYACYIAATSGGTPVVSYQGHARSPGDGLALAADAYATWLAAA